MYAPRNPGRIEKVSPCRSSASASSAASSGYTGSAGSSPGSAGSSRTAYSGSAYSGSAYSGSAYSGSADGDYDYGDETHSGSDNHSGYGSSSGGASAASRPANYEAFGLREIQARSRKIREAARFNVKLERGAEDVVYYKAIKPISEEELQGRRKKPDVPDPRVVKNQAMMDKLTAEAELALPPNGRQPRTKKQLLELTPEMSAAANDLRRKVMAGRGKKKWQKKLKERWERPPTLEYEDTDMVLALRARRSSEEAARQAADADSSEPSGNSTEEEEGEETEVFRLVRRDGEKILERAVTTQKKKRPPDPRVMRQQQLIDQLSMLEEESISSHNADSSGEAGLVEESNIPEHANADRLPPDATVAVDSDAAATTTAQEEAEQRLAAAEAAEAEKRLPRVRFLLSTALVHGGEAAELCCAQ
eukprot:SAG31_NODE_2249_length_6085_cov_2.993819_2_plen_420_part_00